MLLNLSLPLKREINYPLHSPPSSPSYVTAQRTRNKPHCIVLKFSSPPRLPRLPQRSLMSPVSSSPSDERLVVFSAVPPALGAVTGSDMMRLVQRAAPDNSSLCVWELRLYEARRGWRGRWGSHKESLPFFFSSDCQINVFPYCLWLEAAIKMPVCVCAGGVWMCCARDTCPAAQVTSNAPHLGSWTPSSPTPWAS